MFINIHTHHSVDSTVVEIQNLYNNFELINGNGIYSVGMHPWYIENEIWHKVFISLINAAKNTHIVAIGECGLDKICTTDFELQQLVFAKQVELANQINKPLIIHCVRAYEEVIAVLNKLHNQVPVVFHGFNKHLKLAQRLISKGYYLSFGKELMRKRMQEVLVNLPLNNIFFETDDASITIQTVYQTAAAALQIEPDLLCLQIQQNATKVFNV